MTRLNDLADEIRDLKGHAADEPLEGDRIAGIWEQIQARRDAIREECDVTEILDALDHEHDKAKRFAEIIRCQTAVLRTIHDALDNVYDVDEDGWGNKRESPFSGCGALLALIDIALAKVNPAVPRETAELQGSDVFVYRKMEDERQNASPTAQAAS